jgi:hypothetical protein
MAEPCLSLMSRLAGLLGVVRTAEAAGPNVLDARTLLALGGGGEQQRGDEGDSGEGYRPGEGAAERGGRGMAAEYLGPRIVTLPADLIRHEMLLTRDPIPERTLTEIIDEVFLPLIRATARVAEEEDETGKVAVGRRADRS